MACELLVKLVSLLFSSQSIPLSVPVKVTYSLIVHVSFKYIKGAEGTEGKNLAA